MPAINKSGAWLDDPTGDATMPATMLDTLLVFLSMLVELPLGLPLAPGASNPTPAEAAELTLDEG